MGKLHSAVSYRGFPGGARLPGGQLLWLVQVSRSMQAPSRRLPGTSHTSWYFCLRFYTHSPQPSTATGQPQLPRALQTLGKEGTIQQLPATTVLLLLLPLPRLLDTALWMNSGNSQKFEDEESQAPASLGTGFCWGTSLLTLQGIKRCHSQL